MSVSMSIREVEHRSLSACQIITNTQTNADNDTNTNTNTNTTNNNNNQQLIVTPDITDGNKWTETMRNSNTNTPHPHPYPTMTSNNEPIIHSIVPFASLPAGTTLRVAPMEWHCGGWAEEHFHPSLRLPLTASTKGMVVTLQAMARECVTIALSPSPSFIMGKTYAIHIGASHNLQTVIRRRINEAEAVDVTNATPNICNNEKYVSYWVICHNDGRVSAGIGSCPGSQCIATLDDVMYHALRSGVDAVKYVGIGNSALGRHARDVKVRNVRVMPIPECYTAPGMMDGNGGGDIPLSMYDPLRAAKESSARDAELWREYQNECEKAKKRAIKFGIEYKQPQPDAFLKWSEARRLRANVHKGFITGMDIMSKEEREKAKKRKERFEEEQRRNKAGEGGEEDGDEDGDGDDIMGTGENGDEDQDHGEDRQEPKKRDPLPMVQAWDNEELVQDMRVDPPESLYLDKEPQTTEGTMVLKQEDAASSDADANVDASTAIQVFTKIHLFAIDWAAFKQIRTDDILSFFRGYGPTYVEWLGELSCNVLFEDRYSAARALEALSRAIPLEIPCSDDDANDAVMDADDAEQVDVMNVKYENEGDDKQGLLPQSDTTVHQAITAQPKPHAPISSTNLGRMGWRFCNYPLRKIQSDRYGKRGTRSRCLLRIATSLDVLDERPTTWPKPPPGFTTRRVLGPGSDFRTYSDNRDGSKRSRRGRGGGGGGGGGGKRRRRNRGGNYDYDREDRDRWEDYDEADYYQDDDLYGRGGGGGRRGRDRGRDRSRDRGRYGEDDDHNMIQETDEFGRSTMEPEGMNRGLRASR